MFISYYYYDDNYYYYLVSGPRRPAILSDNALCYCYTTNNRCLGSYVVTTVGSCCDNSVDPIGYSFVEYYDLETCQVCPRGSFIKVATTSSLHLSYN